MDNAYEMSAFIYDKIYERKDYASEAAKMYLS